jgi:hypothetical protein
MEVDYPQPRHRRHGRSPYTAVEDPHAHLVPSWKFIAESLFISSWTALRECATPREYQVLYFTFENKLKETRLCVRRNAAQR